MRLRAAVPADAPAIAAIWNPVIRDTLITFNPIEKTPDGIAGLIRARQADGFAFLVAEQAGAVTGFATYGPFRAGEGYRHSVEHTIILTPAARGQGSGRALMAALEEKARKAGLHAMIGGISAAAPDSIAFHAALGFHKVARLPEVGRKAGQWLDLILMQKIL